MTEIIRPYEPGDEEAQVAIYNAAAANLPGFKPAKVAEQQRRVSAPGFRAESRLYFIVQQKTVGYISVQENGRVSYPWTLPGYESCREPLFSTLLNQLKERGISKLYTAYRGDWGEVLNFFQQQKFGKTREMINFRQHLTDLPTTVLRRGINVTPMKKEDQSDLEGRVPNLLRLSGDALEKYLFSNPFFAGESLFVLRKSDGSPQGYGILVEDSQYADVNQIDPLAPCFRLGAFGTEGMSTKRVNALFSFVAEAGRDANPIGLDLLWYAARRLDDSDIETLAAQVPSDAAHLVNFYDNYFRRQGSFPVLEREMLA